MGRETLPIQLQQQMVQGPSPEEERDLNSKIQGTYFFVLIGVYELG
jgi:hypothetical protein